MCLSSHICTRSCTKWRAVGHHSFCTRAKQSVQLVCVSLFFFLIGPVYSILFCLHCETFSPHLAFVKCFHSPSHQTFSTLSRQLWARRSLPLPQRAVSHVSTTFQTTTISVFLEPTATSPPSWWHKDLEPSTTSPWSPRNQWRQGRARLTVYLSF